MAWQGNRGRKGGFLIARRPELVLRSPLLCELEPSATRRAVVVPVESRMCAQDLKAAADEKRQEKEVEEMRGPQPQWIIKSHH